LWHIRTQSRENSPAQRKKLKYGIHKIDMPERMNILENLLTEALLNSLVFDGRAIPKVFPELKRGKYLDCGIVAVSDILELWGHDLNAIEEDGNFFG
jgi:hypothetical protein